MQQWSQGCQHRLSGSNALGQLPPAGVRTWSCRKRHANRPSHSLQSIPLSWETVSIHTCASVFLALRCVHCFISYPEKERGSNHRHHSASYLHSQTRGPSQHFHVRVSRVGVCWGLDGLYGYFQMVNIRIKASESQMRPCESHLH